MNASLPSAPIPGVPWSAGASGAAQATAMPLAQALREAAKVLEGEAVPAALESRVLAAMPVGAACGHSTVQPAADRRRRWLPAWAWPASVALAVLVLSLLLSVTPPTAGEPDLPARGLASGFVPVAGAEAWRDLSDGAMAAWLVRSEMPRERLGLLGLPYDPGRAGESVQAELLVHSSGAVLAVRVLAR